ncbi:hypothetical protein [Methylorubrum extorquens]
MPDPNSTVGELFKAKAVSYDQVMAAVDAYLADPTNAAYPIADGYSLGLVVAVSGYGFASQLVADPASDPAHKREAIRIAILLARAQKA